MPNSTFKFVDNFFWGFKTFITEFYCYAGVQECKFPKALGKNVKIVCSGFLKNRTVSLPADYNSVKVCVSDAFYFCLWLSF